MRRSDKGKPLSFGRSCYGFPRIRIKSSDWNDCVTIVNLIHVSGCFAMNTSCHGCMKGRVNQQSGSMAYQAQVCVKPHRTKNPLTRFSGKSILCSRLVEHLQEQQNLSSAYYFCRFSPTGTDTCVEVMRIVVAQLVKSQPDLLPHIHQNYVDKALNPSLKVMKGLLAQVFSGLHSCRIVLDGIDECHETQQKEILSTFLSLQKNAPNSCKLLISSRVDEGYIKNVLRQKPSIRLKEHTTDAISLFVQQNVAELSDMFDSLEDDLLNRIRHELCSKAGGKCSHLMQIYCQNW